jgi:hypothetical protein
LHDNPRARVKVWAEEIDAAGRRVGLALPAELGFILARLRGALS